MKLKIYLIFILLLISLNTFSNFEFIFPDHHLNPIFSDQKHKKEREIVKKFYVGQFIEKDDFRESLITPLLA